MRSYSLRLLLRKIHLPQGGRQEFIPILNNRQLGSLPEGRVPHGVGEMSAKQTKGDGRVTLSKSLVDFD